MKLLRTSFQFAALSCLAALTATGAEAKVWKASVVPAAINADNTIRFVGGSTQLLGLALQADDAVTKSKTTHNIVLEWDLPAGFVLVGNGGVFKVTASETTVRDGRTIVTCQTEVTNNRILGKPGTRLSSEWRNHGFFVTVPASVAPGQDYIGLKLIDGSYSANHKWKLNLSQFEPVARLPRRTPMGFWDYNYARATSPEAAEGVAQLFKNSGITFTQLASNAVYRGALQKAGIRTGGNTHHDFFHTQLSPNYGPSGKPGGGGFADPHAIIALPEGTPIPGVDLLLRNATAGDGIASYDYEPRGNSGFSPGAIKEFKESYGISDADFEKFRNYVVKENLNTSKTTDPVIAGIWANWTEFRSAQVGGYARRIYQDFKARKPDGTLAITVSRTYGHNSVRSLALGVEQATIAPYADIIMPQIYSGYGAANAKLAIQMTGGWYQRMQELNAKSQLWPLLLVRYAGSNVGNSPQRVRQQTIGALTQGAKGIVYYFPGMLDANYWEGFARLSEEVAKYEDYYQNGKRVDAEFPLSQLPTGEVKVPTWPNYDEVVENPGWSFTAHRLGNKVLLTLINLEESNDLVFGVEIGKHKVLQSENIEDLTPRRELAAESQDVDLSRKNSWLVAPGQIGYIVLETAG